MERLASTNVNHTGKSHGLSSPILNGHNTTQITYITPSFRQTLAALTTTAPCVYYSSALDRSFLPLHIPLYGT